MVFYKDLRASKSQPGSPNGRPEFIVPLHGGLVERHGKEKANKKSLKVRCRCSHEGKGHFTENILTHLGVAEM
jgi:hypothetical protein